MPKKNRIKVIKVYLPKSKKIDYNQSFKPLHRLYLELLENKSKIKQDLVNKEHIISNTYYEKNDQRENFSTKAQKIENFEIIDSDSEEHSNKNIIKEPYNQDIDKDKDKNIDDDNDINIDIDNDKDNDINKNNDINKDKNTDKHKHKDRNRDKHKHKDRNRDKDRDKDRDKYRNRNRDKEEMEEMEDNKIEENKNNESSKQELSDRLNELLNDTDESLNKNQEKSKKNDKYSRDRDNNFIHKSVHKSTPHYQSIHNDVPPTIAELREQGLYDNKEHLRDINQDNEQDLEDKKRELLFKFDLLRKSYPNATVQEFSIHSDLDTMKKTYEDAVRRLSLDSTVENYKTYLIGGFMLVEFIFGNFLKLDMQGFAQQQILSMNSYEKLLIELGEKSYVPKGSKWPVELRLLFLIIMNAAFFIVSKMIMKKTGSNLMNMINGMNSSNATPNTPQKKRKMKGPNIDLNDIPDDTL